MYGNLLTDKSAIRDMWADHFEALGSPSKNLNFDNDFFSRVTRSVHETWYRIVMTPAVFYTSLKSTKKFLMFVLI